MKPSGPTADNPDSTAGPPNKDDEFQALTNYIATVNEVPPRSLFLTRQYIAVPGLNDDTVTVIICQDDNLYDVLAAMTAVMSADPASLVPAFDRKRAVCVVFKLLASENELIRLPGLKLLGYFLCRATIKRVSSLLFFSCFL